MRGGRSNKAYLLRSHAQVSAASVVWSNPGRVVEFVWGAPQHLQQQQRAQAQAVIRSSTVIEILRKTRATLRTTATMQQLEIFLEAAPRDRLHGEGAIAPSVANAGGSDGPFLRASGGHLRGVGLAVAVLKRAGGRCRSWGQRKHGRASIAHKLNLIRQKQPSSETAWPVPFATPSNEAAACVGQ